MSKTPCCQCGKIPAVYQIEGNPLCLDCAYKAEKINYMKQEQYMRQINFLMADMETMVGMPGILPRYEMPKPNPIIKTQGVLTLNNINVNQSVVGSINTGSIEQIDVALTNIKNGGAEETADIIREFTEAVLEEKKLNTDIKNEIIEQLSFLASQAALPEEGQKKSIIFPVLNKIRKGIESIPILLILFEALEKLFKITTG